MNTRVECPYCNQTVTVLLEFRPNGEVIPAFATCVSKYGESCGGMFLASGTVHVEPRTWMLDRPGSEQRLLYKSVRDVEWPTTMVNCLVRGGMLTLGEVAAKTPNELLQIKHLGRKSLNEILTTLDDLKLFVPETLLDYDQPLIVNPALDRVAAAKMEN